MTPAGLGWIAIARLGLVQAALGAVVVLTTSTLNRVMVVELAIAAVIPGLLVGLHYAVQIARPVWGHGSDVGGLLECLCTIRNPTFVGTNDAGWQAEGYDACRAERTTASNHM